MLRCSVVLSNKSTIINTTIFADNSKSNITYFIISSSWSLVMIDKQRKSGIDISHLTYVRRRSDGRKAVHRAIFWIIFVENQSRVMQQHIIPDTKSVYKRRHHSWQKKWSQIFAVFTEEVYVYKLANFSAYYTTHNHKPPFLYVG